MLKVETTKVKRNPFSVWLKQQARMGLPLPKIRPAQRIGLFHDYFNRVFFTLVTICMNHQKSWEKEKKMEKKHTLL